MNKRQRKKRETQRADPLSTALPKRPRNWRERGSRWWRRWRPSLKKAVVWTWEFAREETETWLDKTLKFIFWAFVFFLLGWIMRAVFYPHQTTLMLLRGGWRVVETTTSEQPDKSPLSAELKETPLP